MKRNWKRGTSSSTTTSIHFSRYHLNAVRDKKRQKRKHPLFRRMWRLGVYVCVRDDEEEARRTRGMGRGGPITQHPDTEFQSQKSILPPHFNAGPKHLLTQSKIN